MERFCNGAERFERGILLAALDAAHVAAVQLRFVSKVFLRKASRLSSLANSVAEKPE